MARKKRASIKGRGADILFGEKAPPEKPEAELAKEKKVDIEETLGEEAELAEPELDADLEKAFGDEVGAMEPVPSPVTPTGEPAPPRTKEIISPPLEVPPSLEPRRVSVTLKMEEPLPPLAALAPGAKGIPPPTTYPPVSPPPREAPPPPEISAKREEPVYEPPPYVPEPAPAVAPPATPPGRPLVSPYDRPPPEIEVGGYLFEHPVDVGKYAGLPPGVSPPKERVEPKPPEESEIPSQLSPEIDQSIVLRRLGRERQQALYEEIDALVVEAAQVLSVDRDLEKALGLLRDARDITIERPRQFDRAEYNVAKVRSMLARKQNISQWSWTYGYPVLLYELVWFLLFLGSLLFDHSLAVFLANITKTTFSDMASLSMEHIFPMWNTMAWGGIGGVVGGMYSLYWHAAVEQDFDKEYLMWYIVQPIMGGILGGIVYLIISAGFISAQVLTDQATTVSAAAKTMDNVAIRAFHSIVACVAGFRQRFVYELLDRIVQVLTPKPESKAEQKAAAEAAKETTT